MKEERFERVVKWKIDKEDFFAMWIISILLNILSIIVFYAADIWWAMGIVIFFYLLTWYFQFNDLRLRKVYYRKIREVKHG